jgi:dihydroorotase
LRTLFHNARLIDPASGFDGPGAVLVEDGVIAAWGEGVAVSGNTQAVDCGGLVLAPGLIDLRVKAGEPGEESRETLETASKAAIAGGITSMVVMPDTSPPVDDVALVEFIQRRGADAKGARVMAAGALTQGLKGTAMAEIGLMGEAGAVFFTDADAPVADAGVLKRAMSYAASRGATVFSRPDTQALGASGVMNAGVEAARKGLAGMPPEAEWIGAARDLLLAEATGVRLVIDMASTARTLELAGEARARGVEVHSTIAAFSLFFNEVDVGDYLTYCKTRPPFRREADRLACIGAVARGEVAAVVSAHDPQPPEAKRLPFGEAEFGAAGLETLLATMTGLVADGHMDLLTALRPLTSGPADLLGLAQGRLAEGAPADLTLIDMDKPWRCVREALVSRSVNSPYDGRRLTGLAVRTVVGGETVFAV